MFRWRDLSINLSFAYRLGGQLYNSTLASKVENADKRYNVDERVFTDRWQKTGDQTLFKGLNNESSTMQPLVLYRMKHFNWSKPVH